MFEKFTADFPNIPVAMASAIRVETNPVYGLMTGMPVGALLTSSQFLSVAVTSVMALVVSCRLANRSSSTRC